MKYLVRYYKEDQPLLGSDTAVFVESVNARKALEVFLKRVNCPQHKKDEATSIKVMPRKSDKVILDYKLK